MLISWVYLYPQTLGSSPSLEWRSIKIATDDLRGSTKSQRRQTPGSSIRALSWEGGPCLSTSMIKWLTVLLLGMWSPVSPSPQTGTPENITKQTMIYPPDWQHMPTPMLDYPHSLLNYFLPINRWNIWILSTTAYSAQQIQTPVPLFCPSLSSLHCFLPESSVMMMGLGTATRMYWRYLCVCVCAYSLYVL